MVEWMTTFWGTSKLPAYGMCMYVDMYYRQSILIRTCSNMLQRDPKKCYDLAFLSVKSCTVR